MKYTLAIFCIVFALGFAFLGAIEVWGLFMLAAGHASVRDQLYTAGLAGLSLTFSGSFFLCARQLICK
jgi:hypothetical protein